LIREERFPSEGKREAFLAVRGHGTAVLVASHDERVIEVADRTVRLDEGRVVT
jgi:ABC-type ATPase involved in cell division